MGRYKALIKDILEYFFSPDIVIDRLDVTDEKQVSGVAERFPDVNTLFNCAGCVTLHLRLSVKKCMCVCVCVSIQVGASWSVGRYLNCRLGKLLQDQRHKHVLPFQVFGDAGTIRR